MSAQDYYGGSRQNSHTPVSKRSSKQYLSAPLVDSAGYYPQLDRAIGERPRSAMANRSEFGNGYYGRSRSRSTGPPGSDADLGTGKEAERGLLSTIGGGAAGGYAGNKLFGGKLGTVAGALGGSVVANKIEHRLSGRQHYSSHQGYHGHHYSPPPPYHDHHHHHPHLHHSPTPPPHCGPPHHDGHQGSGGFGGLVGSLMGGGKHRGNHGHHEHHHGHHGRHGGPRW